MNGGVLRSLGVNLSRTLAPPLPICHHRGSGPASMSERRRTQTFVYHYMTCRIDRVPRQALSALSLGQRALLLGSDATVGYISYSARPVS